MKVERKEAVTKVYGWGGWKMPIFHPNDPEYCEHGCPVCTRARKGIPWAVAVQKADLQNAADAAALAGVVDLPSNANAVNTAVLYAKANGMDVVENKVLHNTDKVVIDPLPGNRLQVVCSSPLVFILQLIQSETLIFLIVWI